MQWRKLKKKKIVQKKGKIEGNNKDIYKSE